MVVSSRDSLDTACISPISADLMFRRWAFRAELNSPPSVKSSRDHMDFSKGLLVLSRCLPSGGC